MQPFQCCHKATAQALLSEMGQEVFSLKAHFSPTVATNTSFIVLLIVKLEALHSYGVEKF